MHIVGEKREGLCTCWSAVGRVCVGQTWVRGFLQGTLCPRGFPRIGNCIGVFCVKRRNGSPLQRGVGCVY